MNALARAFGRHRSVARDRRFLRAATSQGGRNIDAPELNFQVSDASVVRHAAVPTLGLQLSISQSEPRVPIESVLLECQVRIEPTRRQYSPAEQSRLSDLFGEPARWGRDVAFAPLDACPARTPAAAG